MILLVIVHCANVCRLVHSFLSFNFIAIIVFNVQPPPLHRTDNLLMLRLLMWLCRDTADHEETNKMSPTNLAIVFGPNLLKSASEDMMSAAEDSQ